MRRGILFSLGVHGLVSVAFLFHWAFFPDEELPPLRAVKVDIVGLPDKVLPAKTNKPVAEEATLPPPPVAEKLPDVKPIERPKPPPKEESVKLPDKSKVEDAKKLEAQKKKQQEALRKMEAASAFDKILQDEKRQKDKATKGAQVQEGGASGSLDALQRESYESAVEEHSKKHWELPKWLSSQSLSATVLVKLDPNGNVIDRKVMQPSGNALYDNWVLETVDKASPFPAPPSKFIARVGTEGLVLAFP